MDRNGDIPRSEARYVYMERLTHRKSCGLRLDSRTDGLVGAINWTARSNALGRSKPPTSSNLFHFAILVNDLFPLRGPSRYLFPEAERNHKLGGVVNLFFPSSPSSPPLPFSQVSDLKCTCDSHWGGCTRYPFSNAAAKILGGYRLRVEAITLILTTAAALVGVYGTSHI
jgi:hypothetical protein